MQEVIDPLQFDAARLSLAIFHATNLVRDEFHLPLFRPSIRLNEAADLQAASCALGKTTGHHHILPSLDLPNDRVAHVGLAARAVAENAATLPLWDVDLSHGLAEEMKGDRKVIIDSTNDRELIPYTYAGYARAVVQAWMASPGHRANIVHPSYQYLGCAARPASTITGVDTITAIQVFFIPLRGTVPK
jgi:uncharacterized protein YkwD